MTQQIVCVIGELGYSGAATQLAVLMPRLPGDRHDVAVCALGPDGPMGESLRRLGVSVVSLGWRRLIDLKPLWRLRTLLKEVRPSIVHAWRLPALRAVALASAGLKPRPHLVASMALPPQRHDLSFLDRRLLLRADRVITSASAESERCAQAGVSVERIAMIPPAVAAVAAAVSTRELAFRTLGLPLAPDARLIVCVGPFHEHKGFRDAVWAFDILKYLYHDLHLVLVGTGPETARLRQFTHTLGANEQVHFMGPVADVASVLALSEVVWVPSRAAGGVNVALEAMAAGKPVLASSLPELAQVVADGETGFLVPPGAKALLARQTRVLLEDAERRRRMGEAGQLRALSHFHADHIAPRLAQLYDSLLTSDS